MGRSKHLRELQDDYQYLVGGITDAVNTELVNLAKLCELEESLINECKERGTTQRAQSGYENSAPWFTNLIKVRETILKQKQHLGFRKEHDDKAPIISMKDVLGG